jgi:hypothetical protein
LYICSLWYRHSLQVTVLCTGSERTSFLTGGSERTSFLTGGSERTSFLTGAQDSHLQRVTVPEAAYIQLRRRPPEDEQGNVRNM